MKKIYDNFSDRLFTLSEKNKCLFLGALPKKGFYNLSEIDGAEEFLRGDAPSFYMPHKLSADEKYYIGYPYYVARKNRMKIRAPLLFFPVVQDEDGNISASGPAIPNRALFLLSDRSKTKRLLKILSDVEIDCAKQFTDILSECDPAFEIADKKGLISFDVMPEISKKQMVLPVAVLGRFPVATEIQEDYYRLKKGGLTTPTLEQLLTGKQKKIKQPVEKVFYTEKLDFSQEKALLSSGNNIVLFGPPGTGKSQTISAIVGNCLANGKNVLVVCQKKVALNIVYSRLGELQKKAFLSVDPKSEKDAFFKALAHSYEGACAFERNDDEKQLAKIEAEIKSRLAVLESIDGTLQKKTSFGLTLREMYALSCRHPESKQEADLINDFAKTGLLNENHEKINYDVTFIKNSRLTEKFIEYQNIFRKNELSFHVREADIKLLSEVRNCCGVLPCPFPFEKHPYGRIALSLFLENGSSVDKIASDLTYSQRPIFRKLVLLSALPSFWFLAPLFIYSYQKRKNEIKNNLVSFFDEYEKYIAPYATLKKFFDKDGYAKVVHAITNGADPMSKINETIDNYLTVRTLKSLFSGLNDEIKSLLLFCYEHSEKTAESMNAVLDKVVPIRIYHELLTCEPQAEKTLSDTQRYSETVKTILSLREKRVKLCRKIAADKCNENILDFKALFKEKSKEFLFQLGTPSRNIRQMYSDFGEYVTRLLPCLLTTPEVVSKILPLQKELFDVVIFDEASQLSAENAIPAVYRGKTMIVAGDDKQLPPPSTFSQKPTGSDVEDLPESVFRARSLLDLAVTVFTPVKLTHHYRSEFRELIDFSNAHFYGGSLIISPNIRPHADPPIRYIMVHGKRVDRKNEREAEEITRLAEMYSYIGTVGIITFNAEQCDLIQEKIEKKAKKDQSFSKKWNDCFVKSIENVQGEEKDYVLFSVGYAPDKNGKIYARFGSLGTEGGEKRLNVAVTRAKKKMMIVTSIDPEELSVAGVKNEGPKLLKKFLEYAKNVSEQAPVPFPENIEKIQTETEKEIADKLREIGYDVRSGQSVDPALSIAVYDRGKNVFLLGIDTDELAYRHGGSVYERDVDKTDFFAQKGWKILRVWTRDWWLSSNNVIRRICSEAEKARISAQDLSFRFSTVLSLPAGAEFTQNGTGEIAEN